MFSTEYREPLICDDVKDELYAYLGGVCQALECHPMRVGGYHDHIHMLCILSRKIALMTLLEEVKKRSSKWMKTKGVVYEGFYWQDGYGAFSVNPSQIDRGFGTSTISMNITTGSTCFRTSAKASTGLTASSMTSGTYGTDHRA